MSAISAAESMLSMIFWTKMWGEMVTKTESFGEFVISTNQQQPQADKIVAPVQH